MSKTPPTPRNGMRILIVGRDPQHRGQLAQLVHQTVPQTNVTVFTSPSAAVQHMQQHICHVLFLAESVIDKRYNHMAVDMDKLDCDWDSDWDTSKLARRRFMLQYDWAGPETIVPPVQEGP